MGQVKQGQRLVVMGQGVIGRLATLLGRAIGVEEVICITQSRAKLVNSGDGRRIATEDAEAIETIRSLAGDVVIDATGNPEAIHTAILATREGGKIVLLGSNRGSTTSFGFNGLPMQKRISIVGAHIRNQHLLPSDIGLNYQDEARVIQELIEQKRLSLGEVITCRTSWFDLMNYYNKKLSTDRGACAVLVDWTKTGEFPSPERLNVQRTPVYSRLKPLRMALMGCGDIGKQNAAAISDCAGFELAVVMDTNFSLAEDLGRKYGVRFTDDIDRVIGDQNIDAILIAVPHYLHAPLAREVASAGKNVLVEKPLAISLEEGASMIRTAQENKVLLRTFLPYPYQFNLRIAKELIDKDALGNVIGICVMKHTNQSQRYWYGGYSGRSTSDWRTRRDLSGGGFLLMNLTHNFDSLCEITGIKIKTVFAEYGALYHSFDVEDTIGLTFRGTKGEIGTVSAGSTVKGSRDEVTRIWGECGQIVVRDNGLEFYSLRQFGEFRAKRWHRIGMKSREDIRVMFLDNFRQEIENERQTDFSEPGYLALGIVMAAYQSGKLSRPVDVNSLLELHEKREKEAVEQ